MKEVKKGTIKERKKTLGGNSSLGRRPIDSGTKPIRADDVKKKNMKERRAAGEWKQIEKCKK